MATPGNGSIDLEDASTAELARAVVSDTATLARKELELARHELVEAVTARLKAAGAAAVAGVLGLLAVIFLGFAAAEGLQNVLRPWAAFLVVAGGFLVVTGAAAAFALVRATRPPLAPEETKRTVKEGVDWARTRLRR